MGRTTFKAALLLVILATAPYLGSINGDFLRDDPVYITNNVDVQKGRPLGELLTRSFPPHSPHGLYRPLTTLSFQLDQSLGNGGPLAFRITNLLLHAAAVVLLFYALLQIGLERSTAALATAFFAVSPTHVEVVSSITGRAESLAFVLGLGATLLLLARSRWYWMGLAPLFFLASTLAKENGIMWVGVAGVLLFCKKEWRTALPRLALASVAALMAPALKWLATGAVTLPPSLTSFGPMGIAETNGLATRLLGWDYPLMAIYPPSISLDHPALFEPGSLSGWAVLAGVLVLMAMVVFSIRALRRGDRSLLAGLIIYLLLLLPFLHVVTPIGDTRAPRFFFGASAVLSLGFAIGLQRILQRFSQPVRLGAFTAAGLWWAVFAGLNATHWRSDSDLWAAELARAPHSPKAIIYSTELDPDATQESRLNALTTALEKWPHHPESLMRRAIFALKHENDAEGARGFLQRLHDVHPNHAGQLTLMAAVDLRLGNQEASLARLREARASDRHDPVCRQQLAKDAERRGSFDEAEVLWREVAWILLSSTEGYAPQIPGVLLRLQLLMGRGALTKKEFLRVVERCLDEMPHGDAREAVASRFGKGL